MGETFQPEATALKVLLANFGVSATAEKLKTCRRSVAAVTQFPRSKRRLVGSVQPSVKLSVLPSLQVNVVSGTLSTEESLTLDTWAVEATDRSWRLDRQKAVGAIEKGRDIAELRAFLQTRENQPLPETVESFIKTAEKQGKALKISGTTLLIDCEHAEIAAMIATHKETASLCLRAGDRQLVVRLENEEKFRTQIRILGFGMTT